MRIYPALVFAPVRIQEEIPGVLFMYWLCAGGQSLIHPSSLDMCTPCQALAKVKKIAEAGAGWGGLSLALKEALPGIEVPKCFELDGASIFL